MLLYNDLLLTQCTLSARIFLSLVLLRICTTPPSLYSYMTLCVVLLFLVLMMWVCGLHAALLLRLSSGYTKALFKAYFKGMPLDYTRSSCVSTSYHQG
jgi:hypothetical protein